MHKLSIFCIMLLFTVAACDKDDNKSSKTDYTYTFSNDTEGWNAFFSDYHVGQEDFYELSFGHSHLPSPLDTSQQAMMISGNNHSDDLLMLVYRKFEGLQPGREYSVTFDIDLASNAPTNSIGIGGSPDLSLGAGGLTSEPSNTIDDEGLYRPNFSSDLQSHVSNNTLQVIGTIGVGDDATDFMLINRNNLGSPFKIKANNQGELWLMIGTDSGFEGTTTLYYRNIRIKIL